MTTPDTDTGTDIGDPYEYGEVEPHSRTPEGMKNRRQCWIGIACCLIVAMLSFFILTSGWLAIVLTLVVLGIVTFVAGFVQPDAKIVAVLTFMAAVICLGIGWATSTPRDSSSDGIEPPGDFETATPYSPSVRPQPSITTTPSTTQPATTTPRPSPTPSRTPSATPTTTTTTPPSEVPPPFTEPSPPADPPEEEDLPAPEPPVDTLPDPGDPPPFTGDPGKPPGG